MREDESLLHQLTEYSRSDFYPFHMPGHKRQWEDGFAGAFPNPFCIDITEIDGFDNLHNPEGILKKSMEWAAGLYGANRTYYLVNGSSCGILSAICGTTHNSDTILLARNSHKSAYHGVFLNHLRAEYIYPQILQEYCVQGGLLPDEMEKMLKTHENIASAFVVSPTYDGIVSDIKTIATVCHKHKIPLIVDEAHGAHFRYGDDFPVSALELGADVVIQSLHKTLPSFTQTALLHVREGYVDVERIERYLRIYQSSSPSYLFMAGMENCIRWMEGEGRQRMKVFAGRLRKMRARLETMKHLRLMGREIVGHSGVYDLDISKVVISTRGTSLDGVRLSRILRESYHLEMEMCGLDYVTAITSVADTEEGLNRLADALLQIDAELEGGMEDASKPFQSGLVMPQIAMSVSEALEAGETEGKDRQNGGKYQMPLSKAAGKISAEYVYIYPPGIPIVAPGEILQPEIVETILTYLDRGFPVQGAKELNQKKIWVIKNKSSKTGF